MYINMDGAETIAGNELTGIDPAPVSLEEGKNPFTEIELNSLRKVKIGQFLFNVIKFV